LRLSCSFKLLDSFGEKALPFISLDYPESHEWIEEEKDEYKPKDRSSKYEYKTTKEDISQNRAQQDNVPLGSRALYRSIFLIYLASRIV